MKKLSNSATYNILILLRSFLLGIYHSIGEEAGKFRRADGNVLLTFTLVLVADSNEGIGEGHTMTAASRAEP